MSQVEKKENGGTRKGEEISFLRGIDGRFHFFILNCAGNIGTWPVMLLGGMIALHDTEVMYLWHEHALIIYSRRL
jgi:hypothetical protein